MLICSDGFAAVHNKSAALLECSCCTPTLANKRSMARQHDIMQRHLGTSTPFTKQINLPPMKAIRLQSITQAILITLKIQIVPLL